MHSFSKALRQYYIKAISYSVLQAQQNMVVPTKTEDSDSKELRNQESFEIHILGVPLNMTEDGLLNVFGKFGRVIRCFIAKPKPDSQVINLIFFTLVNYFESNIFTTHF